MSATNVAQAGKRGNICVGKNVSVTMCPRLPGPLGGRSRNEQTVVLCTLVGLVKVTQVCFAISKAMVELSFMILFESLQSGCH